jgi:hypothetical protein
LQRNAADGLFTRPSYLDATRRIATKGLHGFLKTSGFGIGQEFKKMA